MALAGKDVTEEKKTGFTHNGNPIILSKTRGRPPNGKLSANGNGFYHENKRIEALTVFAATGVISKVYELTKVPVATFKKWLTEPWALDLLEQIRNENDQALDAKFTSIINGAVDQIQDRIENGDFVVTRTGETVRKPIGARDLSTIATTNIEKRQLMRGKPTSRTEKVTEGSRLKRLEEAFIKLANTKKIEPPKEITDIEYEEIKNESRDSEEMGRDAYQDSPQGSP